MTGRDVYHDKIYEVRNEVKGEARDWTDWHHYIPRRVRELLESKEDL